MTPPAHRPSRRADIVDAAIRLFARRGFVDTSIADVADESDVVVTAVYYHFSGKEELFTAAVHKVFDSISAVVSAVRSEVGVSDDEMLGSLVKQAMRTRRAIRSHPIPSTSSTSMRSRVTPCSRRRPASR